MPGQYVYAVVTAGGFAQAGHQSGIDGAAVTEIQVEGIAALTSDCDADRIRPTRVNLGAHEQVVQAAHDCGPVLPVRFGTLMPDSDAVREELLAPNAELFESSLAELVGLDEFRLRITYLPDVALRDVLRQSPSLRRKRDRIASGRGRVGQGHLIDLGQAVAAELEALRDAEAEQLLMTVAPHVDQVQRLPDRADSVALHAALLVNRAKRQELDAVIDTIGDAQHDRLTAELIGPMPPWDFAGASFKDAAVLS